MINQFFKIKKDMPMHGEEEDFKNKENKEPFTKKKSKINKSDNMNNLEL